MALVNIKIIKLRLGHGSIIDAFRGRYSKVAPLTRFWETECGPLTILKLCSQQGLWSRMLVWLISGFVSVTPVSPTRIWTYFFSWVSKLRESKTKDQSYPFFFGDPAANKALESSEFVKTDREEVLSYKYVLCCQIDIIYQVTKVTKVYSKFHSNFGHLCTHHCHLTNT